MEQLRPIVLAILARICASICGTMSIQTQPIDDSLASINVPTSHPKCPGEGVHEYVDGSRVDAKVVSYAAPICAQKTN